MTVLSVNLNKVALIRNSRDTTSPSPVEFAAVAIAAGAGGITVHPRPDQRHIRVSDCHALAQSVDVEFNIEGNPFADPMASDRAGVSDYPGFMALVEATRPAQATLVPDGNAQLTSDHGFDLRKDSDRLAPIIAQLKDWGCRVSLFMDPEPEDMALAAAIGADRVELYTESYAVAFAAGDYAQALDRFSQSAACCTCCRPGRKRGTRSEFSKPPRIHYPALTRGVHWTCTDSRCTAVWICRECQTLHRGAGR